MRKIIFLMLIATIISSCTSKKEKELEELNAYLSANNINTEPTASGLYFIETRKGTGDSATVGSKVSVHYKGTFLDGSVFDSSYDRGTPIEFNLGTGMVIAGWDEGISYMKEGGKATLIIPSNLAYGPKDYAGIPAYSTLIFEVELIDVQ